MILRPYQQDAVDAFLNCVSAGQYSGVISAPTGSGKSAILAEVCRLILTNFSESKILVVTHRYELIEQDRAELIKHYPAADTGIYSAGLGSRDTTNRVIFAGIQSIASIGDIFGKVDLCIIDEAHKVNTEEGTSYAKLLQSLRDTNPNLVVLGLSATPYRLSSGLLYEGEDRLFECLYYEVDIMQLIHDGYLCPVISKGGVDKIDVSEVSTVAGEYNSKELTLVTDNTTLTRHAVDEMIKYGADRKAWMVFTTSIEHAIHVSEELTSRGIVSHVVTSETIPIERTLIIQKYKEGKLRCIVNVGVLVEGFNAPQTDMVVLLMATKSPGKFVQSVGRGMRICEGKTNCLVLDFGGNTARLGTIDNIQAPAKKTKGEGDGEAPAKECPHCHTYMHTRARTCPECGFEMPAPILHAPSAYEGAMLSEPEWIDINNFAVSRHLGKNGKPDTLRVDYITDMSYYPISQWICLEHPTGSFPRKKADDFVAAMGGCATNIADAIKESLYVWKVPARVKAQKDGKFWRVLGLDIPDDAKPAMVNPEIQDMSLDQFC